MGWGQCCDLRAGCAHCWITPSFPITFHAPGAKSHIVFKHALNPWNKGSSPIPTPVLTQPGVEGKEPGGAFSSPKWGCALGPQVAPFWCRARLPAEERRGFQPCSCALHRSLNYRFSAADRWARICGGIGSQTLSFSLVRVPLQRGESRNFLRKVRSGLSRPQHEYNDRCILQQAGTECARPQLLLSAKSLFFVIY